MPLSRREFISLTAMTGTSLALNSLETFAKPLNTSNSLAGYSLLVFATNWGFSGSWDTFCAKVKQDGYDGIEVWYPSEEKERQDLFTALKKHGLQVGFLVGG